MAKGVKRIKWTGEGRVIKKLSESNVKVAIPPDQDVSFDVDVWYEGTSEAEKKNPITWILQDYKTRTIILEKVHVAAIPQTISIPRPLCGPFEYYIEASLFGKRDFSTITGLRVRGECTPKIVSSKWCTTNDSNDIRKSHFFKYGETVYLNLTTEGLNGHLNLIVDVFRNIGGSNDPSIARYTSIDVIDGEINLEINNTYAWYGKLKSIKEREEFYVKVFDPVKKTYIPDNNNDTIHARFLRIDKKISSKEIKTSKNLSPLKTGEAEVNFKTPSFCRYNKVIVSDVDSNKNKFDLVLYDAVITKNITDYETIAGSSVDKMKSLDFTFTDLNSSKACFNKGQSNEHKKEAIIYLNGVKQKTELIKNERLSVGFIADSNLILLRAKPELFFFSPDKVSKYQIFTKTCAQPSGVINLNVYPNIEREVAFIVSLFGIKGLNAETNIKDVKTGNGGLNRIGKRDTLTGYSGEKGMKLVDGQLEVLFQKKGSLGFGVQVKVKIDNVVSSIESGRTKNQIKELIGFYNKIIDKTKDLDGRGREGESLAYRKGSFPKATFDLEAPNVALAMRITNKKIENTANIVREYSGGLALKPITGIKIGVDLISLIPYFGWQGKIADEIIKFFSKREKIEIYIIFEISFQARADFNLAYNEIEGLKAGTQKLEIEALATGKIGIKSKEKVTLTIVTSDGTTDKADVEKFKGEGSIASGLLYTYEIKGDKKGMYSQHKLEFTGVKASIVIYSLNERRKFNTYCKKDFTLIEKPSEPWAKSDKNYL